MNAVWRSFALSALVAIAGCGEADGSALDRDDDGTIGVTQADVQVQGAGYQFAIVQDGSRASKATGALEIALLRSDGSLAMVSPNMWARGTCGVTFIAPHYAITASHCVDSKNLPDPANSSITVRQYDVTTADLSSLYLASRIAGTFPNYHPETSPVYTVPGYQMSSYVCKVVSRCAFPGSSNYNCDGLSGDVAMLQCSGRASNAAWLPVAGTEQPGGPVEMYWFHELLSVIPLDPPPAGAPIENYDRFNHYTALGTSSDTLANQLGNWHYAAASTNWLLPLKSIPFSNGTPRTRFGSTNVTNLYGCHGTSGSGVLQRNSSGELELLGPASQGGWGSNRLCAHPYNFQPGSNGVIYTANTIVQQLQSKYSKTLTLDRYPIRRQLDPIYATYAQ